MSKRDIHTCVNLRWLLVLTVLFSATDLKAQDVHFSQFFMSPMTLNPSLAGDFDPEYRFAANYRDQWRSVTENPFTTFSFSAENNGTFGQKSLGTGLMVMSDQAGDGQLKTLAVNLAGAYSFAVNADSTSTLRLGTQIGFTQKRIDYTGFRFDRQYTGQVYDPSLDTREQFTNDKITHPNVHLGLRYRKDGEGRNEFNFGASAFNLTSPNVAFNTDADSPLDQRGLAHADMVIEVSDDWDVMPAAQYMTQGSYQELLLGSRFRRTWRQDAIGLRRGWIGAFGRLSDAAFVTAGVDYDAWSFGVSYDINLSPLDVASNNRGGIELSAIYLLDIFNETRKRHRACPAWL